MNNSDTPPDFGSEPFLSALRNRGSRECEQVVRAYTEQLLKAALGLGFERTNAQDLVQNCWATFFDVVPRFEGKSHIRTFLFGILYNKASEMRRDQKKLQPSEEIENLLNERFDEKGNWISPPINAEKFLIASETMDLIQKCLEGLPLNQRMAFSMREIDETDTKEICNVLEVTATNLGVLLYRARNSLRECIEGKAKRARNG